MLCAKLFALCYADNNNTTKTQKSERKTVLLDLKNIRKDYQAPSGNETVTVLKDISLNVEQGEAIAVVGPSGSGKSTLLNIIGALDKPTAGIVNFDGNDLSTLTDSELAKIRNREIGFVFQLHHLLPQCTVLENVLVPTIPLKSGNDNGSVESRAKQLLTRVGLENHFNYFPAQLSGGEQQRVAVVRALINKPKLILADEPTGSLDQVSSGRLGKLLIELNKEEGVTLIVVTHSIELAKLMDKVFTIQNGILKEV